MVILRTMPYCYHIFMFYLLYYISNIVENTLISHQIHIYLPLLRIRYGYSPIFFHNTHKQIILIRSIKLIH